MKHLPVTLTTENPLLWHFLCEEDFLTDLLKKSSGTSPQYICAIYANLTLPVTGCFWPSFYRYLDSCCLVPMSCLTLCDSTNCSPPGSSVPGISQARILEWVAISFSRGSSQPRNQTQVSCVSCIAGGFFTTEPPGIINRFYQFWIWWDSAKIPVSRSQPSQPTLQTGLSEESNLRPAMLTLLCTHIFLRYFVML